MSHLLIKTTCDRGSKSRDKKVFTFCQNGHCCSTSPLRFQNENCKENHLYHDSEIGECAQFKFDFDYIIEGNVTNEDLPPEMDIQLLFKDSSVSACTIVTKWNQRLDVNAANEPKFLDFVCKKPKGIMLSLVAHPFGHVKF